MKRILKNPSDESPTIGQKLLSPIRRSTFLKFAGATVVTTGLVVAGCSDDDDSTPAGVDLGSGDTGILNYAYLLEQLEAAFYVKVTESLYSGVSVSETAILKDIRDHELSHRDFFKKALGGSAIASVEFDFSSINFADRASVLGAAMTFEDLGVSAYNGAGKLFESKDFLLLAGKIVSVEARHASAIRDLLKPFTAYYAGDDVVTVDTGLDVQNSPPTVLSAAKKYIKNAITFDKLPS